MIRAELWEALANVDGVEEAPSMFKNAPALWVNGTEIAHDDGEQALDVRLTRALIRADREQLRADPASGLRPSSSADWIQVHIDGPSGARRAVELVEQAAGAHRAGPGTASRPPPTGPELDRRRRFH